MPYDDLFNCQGLILLVRSFFFEEVVKTAAAILLGHDFSSLSRFRATASSEGGVFCVFLMKA
ncbi:MAG: hypothetical protein JM57_09075 [Comamonadaceae bacterium BICA1-1]|nr:MAG: hypothetical protein JM57_09075 [Comamonadaceae bacterium BICA1-1]